MKKQIFYESNIKSMILKSDVKNNEYGVEVIAQPNHKILGKRLGKGVKDVAKALTGLKQSELIDFMEKKQMKILDYDIYEEDLTLSYTIDAKFSSI